MKDNIDKVVDQLVEGESEEIGDWDDPSAIPFLHHVGFDPRFAEELRKALHTMPWEEIAKSSEYRGRKLTSEDINQVVRAIVELVRDAQNY